MLSKDHWQCISQSDIPSLSFLSCWEAVTLAAELHRTLPRLLPKCPRNLSLSEIEQVNRQNPAPLCALVAAEELEACPKFYRNILHWNFNLI